MFNFDQILLRKYSAKRFLAVMYGSYQYGDTRLKDIIVVFIFYQINTTITAPSSIIVGNAVMEGQSDHLVFRESHLTSSLLLCPRVLALILVEFAVLSRQSVGS